MRLVTSNELLVDKSVFTGDRKPVSVICNPQSETTSFLVASNTVFMGTIVVEGSGTAIVIAT
eukprot:gene43869-54505_t